MIENSRPTDTSNAKTVLSSAFSISGNSFVLQAQPVSLGFCFLWISNPTPKEVLLALPAKGIQNQPRPTTPNTLVQAIIMSHLH